MKQKFHFFGFSVTDAHAKTGIPTATISRHATGKRRISAEFAMKYHCALGIPLAAMRPDLWPEDSVKCEAEGTAQ